MQVDKYLRIVCLIVLPLGCPAAHAEPDGKSSGGAAGATPTTLVAPVLADLTGLSIAAVNIDNGPIFDLDNPAEDRWLYRLANRAHMKTRPDVIRAQLLFDSGDPLSPQKIEESERLLRANRYLQEASIESTLTSNGEVEIDVQTTDVWTLMPELDLSRSGGENKTAFGIKEMNLLGTGIAVELQVKSDVDRDSTALRVIDRHILQSRYQLATRISENSDGHNYFLDFGKPFYSLDTRESKTLRLVDDDEISSFYDRGERLSDYHHEGQDLELEVGWSKGLRDGWARRFFAGVASNEHRFRSIPDGDYPSTVIPEDRDLLYPFFGIELLEDKYEKGSNYDQIHRTEDRYFGTRLSARLGLASSGAGSDRDAWLFAASAQKGFGAFEKRSLLLASGFQSRVENGDFRNLTFSVNADYYHRQSEHRLFYVGVSGVLGKDLDLDKILALGGDNGLRGYPLRYQMGQRRALLTLEQRFFSDWYPFRLFRVGGAVFFDAGRAWGKNEISAAKNTWLRDVGLGLRLGNTRSGLGRMTHIDLAFPLDGDSDIADLQLVVSTKKSF